MSSFSGFLPCLNSTGAASAHELLEIEATEQERPPGIVASRQSAPTAATASAPGKTSRCSATWFCAANAPPAGNNISLRYPLVELVTAVLFSVTIWHFGPTLRLATALLLTAFLIAMAGIDFDHQFLPDNFTLPLMWGGSCFPSGLFIRILFPVLSAPWPATWCSGRFIISSVLTGKEGMGYGDFKLLAALGAWMGWQALPLVILLSSVVGASRRSMLISTGKLA